MIDPIHPEMRSMTWNCYRSNAQCATLLSCSLIQPMPPQHHGRRLIYKCANCPTYFSETTQPLMAGVKTPVSVIWQVVKARTEGMGLNAAARTLVVSLNCREEFPQTVGKDAPDRARHPGSEAERDRITIQSSSRHDP